MQVARGLQKLRKSSTSLWRRKLFRTSAAHYGEIPALLSKANVLGAKLMAVMTVLIADRKSHYKNGGDKVTEIPIPHQNGHVMKEHEYGVVYPALDEGQTKEGIAAKILQVFAGLGEDNQGDYAKGGLESNTHDFFDSPQASNDWRTTVFGAAWPEEFVDVWPDMSSDQGVAQFCWFGFGGHWIRKPRGLDLQSYGLDTHPSLANDVAYLMPCTDFSLYPVRQPYERYGACAFFNGQKDIIGIYVSYLDTIITPEDDQSAWEHAKYVLKASAATEATMQDHLGSVHLIVGNTISTAVRESFPSNHPLRGFLTPHLFQTATANTNVPVLLAYYGFFHLSWGLTFDSVYGSIGDYRGKYQFLPIRKYIEFNGMQDESDITYPFKDSVDLYEVIEKYVKNFLALYYPNDASLEADEHVVAFHNQISRGNRLGQNQLDLDNFTEVLGHFILNGSGFHEHVGKLLPFVARDDQVGTRIMRGQTRQDIQAFAGAGSLACATTGLEPLLKDDYSFVFLQDDQHEKVMANFREFQAGLVALEGRIGEKNKLRAMPYNNFNPANVGCAVSI